VTKERTENKSKKHEIYCYQGSVNCLRSRAEERDLINQISNTDYKIEY